MNEFEVIIEVKVRRIQQQNIQIKSTFLQGVDYLKYFMDLIISYDAKKTHLEITIKDDETHHRD